MAAQRDERKVEELIDAVRDLFHAAAAEGLFIGAGRDFRLPDDAQEGPRTKRAHAAIEALQEDE